MPGLSQANSIQTFTVQWKQGRWNFTVLFLLRFKHIFPKLNLIPMKTWWKLSIYAFYFQVQFLFILQLITNLNIFKNSTSNCVALLDLLLKSHSEKRVLCKVSAKDLDSESSASQISYKRCIVMNKMDLDESWGDQLAKTGRWSARGHSNTGLNVVTAFIDTDKGWVKFKQGIDRCVMCEGNALLGE